MVLVWMMQLVSPFCQYWLLVVTVRVTLHPVSVAEGEAYGFCWS